jgi:hypothetical protein
MILNTWYRTLKNYWYLRKKNDLEETFNELDISTDEQSAWWDTFTITEQQSRYSNINHIILCIDHIHQGWKITQHFENNKAQSQTKTFITHSPSNEIKLRPCLPDRTLLAPINPPLFLPPKGTLIAYASSPLWIRIEIGSPPQFSNEIPTQMLADTWFGQNTIAGELCYAGKSASSQLEDIAHTTTHAVIPLSIVNYSENSLSLTELRIPLPFLSVYADTHNHLWTEQVNVFFESNVLSETMITAGPPPGINDLSLVTVARFPIHSPFTSLFQLKNLFQSCWKNLFKRRRKP